MKSVQTPTCFVPAANELRTARSTASVYYQNVRGLRTKVDEFRLSPAAQSDRKLLKLLLNVAIQQEPIMIKQGERMGKRRRRGERERGCELFFGHYHLCANTVAYRRFFVSKRYTKTVRSLERP